MTKPDFDRRLELCGWNWPHGRSRSYAVGIIPKAASMSIAAALPIRYGKPSVPTFLFMRDPMGRHQSCFRFFHDHIRHDAARDYFRFTDSVLDGSCTIAAAHWLPQTLLWRGVDATVHAFEHLAAVWNGTGFPPLPHVNKTAPSSLPEYRRDDLIEFYAEDFRARSRG